MDANRIISGAKEGKDALYLRRHTQAVREHQISVGLMFLYLQGYEVELHYRGEPQVWAAKELLDELGHKEQIALWSQSTTAGGVWETWQRDALKYGDLHTTKSWDTWQKRAEKRK